MADIELYVGLVGFFFVVTPLAIMFFRLLTRSAAEGLMSMFTPPIAQDPSQKRLSSKVRGLLYQKSPIGFYLDVAQAGLSAFSCILFIAISYLANEPEWITDIEDVLTVYFTADYSLRLWLAQDSLSYYFSLTSVVDFITVVPALTAWLISSGKEFDVNVLFVIQVREGQGQKGQGQKGQ